MSDIKKTGIIGCGTVVQRTYPQVLPKVQGMDVVYVYDIDELNANKAAQIFNASVVSLEELFAGSDLVFIATPPESHFELCNLSIQAGITTICEKPFMPTFKQADEIIRTAEEKDISVYVNHFRRCYPSLSLVRKIIDTQVFGRIRELKIIEGARFNWEAHSEYISNNKYGGVIYDTGSHSIDMALYASGLDIYDCELIIDSVTRDVPEPSHEIQAQFRLSSDGNFIDCQLHLSRYQNLANKITLVMENGIIELPVGLQNKAKLTGPGGSCTVNANREFKKAAHCFAYQCHQIVHNLQTEIYKAKRFLTLTKLLEKISTYV